MAYWDKATLLSAFVDNGFTTESKTNELGKSTQFYCRWAFLKSKLLLVGRTIVG
jgi:hypothetical protein